MKKVLYVLTSMLTLGAGAQLFADEGGAAARQGNPYSMFIIIGAGLVLFYFMILRPEKKRRKAAAERRAALKKGDRVCAVGIIGIVDKITDETVILKLYDGAKMEVLKAAISEAPAPSQQEVERAQVELAKG
ncbi:MAG: preprotein translocase subunit YajC [Parachlamydiales bacterium]